MKVLKSAFCNWRLAHSFEVCIKIPFRKQDYLINIIYVAKKGKKLNGQRQQVFNLTEAEVMSNLPTLIVAPTCFRDQMRTAKKKVKGAFLSVLSFLPPLSDSSLDETRQRSSIIAVCVKLIVQFLVNLFIFELFPEKFGIFRFQFLMNLFIFRLFPEKFRVFSCWWICLFLDFSRKNSEFSGLLFCFLVNFPGEV